MPASVRLAGVGRLCAGREQAWRGVALSPRDRMVSKRNVAAVAAMIEVMNNEAKSDTETTGAEAGAAANTESTAPWNPLAP